ncbi:hypothetical protein CALCODRAFT_502164 [Calocera cornea HHB12733]|uniref:Uncharacterized protein n=1 Tax=Calocera cornea HHB12733 TaxID=1353952 RepID=A0A165DCX9_9BASI|nr:hypothetical protein CALCODRAFT_502164 [Calocera cornea HHB12733]
MPRPRCSRAAPHTGTSDRDLTRVQKMEARCSVHVVSLDEAECVEQFQASFYPRATRDEAGQAWRTGRDNFASTSVRQGRSSPLRKASIPKHPVPRRRAVPTKSSTSNPSPHGGRLHVHPLPALRHVLPKNRITHYT